jgi:hypothetical protein
MLSLQFRFSGLGFSLLGFPRPSASRLQFSFVRGFSRCGHTNRAHGLSFRLDVGEYVRCRSSL